ncbi:MAG: hypothetical protein AB7P23_06295 [Amphiplicatus sp.]
MARFSDAPSGPKEAWTMKAIAFYFLMALVAIGVGVPAAIATMLGVN